MLRSIKIKRHRSCRDITLDKLGRMTVLVGRNGAGKSNILQSIDWAARTASQPRANNDLRDLFELGVPRSEVTLEFEVGYALYRYTQKKEIIRNNAPEKQTVISIQESLEQQIVEQWTPLVIRNGEIIHIPNKSDIQIAATSPCLPALSSLLPKDDATLQAIQPAANFLAAIHYYPLDEPNVIEASDTLGIIRHAEYAQWLAAYTSKADPGTSVLMRLIHMSQNASEKFDELKQLLGNNGLGLVEDVKVQIVQVPSLAGLDTNSSKANTFYFLQFLLVGGGKAWRNYYQLSFGTRRLIRIIASILFDQSVVMLIEQPEDGIHPGLLHKLIPLLRENCDSNQFILASHSSTIFNRLSPEEIRLVEMTDGITTVRALNSEEISGAEKFISEDGPLSDFIETVQGGD